MSFWILSLDDQRYLTSGKPCIRHWMSHTCACTGTLSMALSRHRYRWHSCCRILAACVCSGTDQAQTELHWNVSSISIQTIFSMPAHVSAGRHMMLNIPLPGCTPKHLEPAAHACLHGAVLAKPTKGCQQGSTAAFMCIPPSIPSSHLYRAGAPAGSCRKGLQNLS